MKPFAPGCWMLFWCHFDGQRGSAESTEYEMTLLACSLAGSLAHCAALLACLLACLLTYHFSPARLFALYDTLYSRETGFSRTALPAWRQPLLLSECRLLRCCSESGKSKHLRKSSSPRPLLVLVLFPPSELMD